MNYDLHIHTHNSRCSNLDPSLILKLAKKKKLNGIAITDHTSIQGALEVKKLNKDKNFEVIIGEEVSTNYGDVLLYYVNKKIDKIDFFDVVDEARKQGAVISLAHPFRTTLFYNHKFRVPIKDVKNKIDAIECFNARTLPGDNKKALYEANRLGIAKTAGSDSHFFFEIGTGLTSFNDNLRDAIKRNDTSVSGTIKVGFIGGALSFLRKKYFR